MKSLLLMKILRKLRGSAYSVEELRAKGVHVGENCYIGTKHVDVDHGFLIFIGNNVTISSARILAHDASTKMALGYSKVGIVRIDDGSFIGADAVVLPGVHIGRNVIIGAGAVVTKDIPDNSVAAGNPARVVCSTDDYIEKNKFRMTSDNTWETHCSQKSDEEKLEMIRILSETRIGFDI